MTRHGGFRLFEKGDVFIFERVPPDATTLTPVMFEDKPVQFADRKAALKWLRMNGHKVEGHAGKKFAIVKMLDLIEISVEARAAVTVLSRQREGASSAPPVIPDTAKAETR